MLSQYASNHRFRTQAPTIDAMFVVARARHYYYKVCMCNEIRFISLFMENVKHQRRTLSLVVTISFCLFFVYHSSYAPHVHFDFFYSLFVVVVFFINQGTDRNVYTFTVCCLLYFTYLFVCIGVFRLAQTRIEMKKKMLFKWGGCCVCSTSVMLCAMDKDVAHVYRQM